MQNRWLDVGRRALPHLGAVAWRLLVAVAVLEFVYLVAATVVLKTSVLKDFAAQGDDLRVDYASAYSVLPGRIHVEDLKVRFHDRNVEFLIAVERGTLDVSLHELFVRRFHALRVDGQRVSYRMRHKVVRVGKEGPRLAAYPPIPGFADPPLYAKGEDRPAPPIPDEQYHLWDVHVEGVRADVAEVWILEYRYRGPGLATGSFRVKPARYYEVPRATLELRGGALTLGDTVVAKETVLAIDCEVSGSDPRRLVGLEPVRAVRAGARGRLEGTDLAFLDAYFGPRLGAAAAGLARVELDVRVDNGVVTSGSGVALSAPHARFSAPGVGIVGPVSVGLTRPRDSARSAPFDLRLRSERLTVELAERAEASVENVDVEGAFTPDLVASVDLVRASLAPVRVEARDLAALGRALPFAKKLPALGGRATLVAEAKKDGAGPIRGRFRLALSEATLAVDGRRTQPASVTLASENAESDPPRGTAFAGTLTLHVDRASALLPLVTPSPFLRRLEERLLELDALDATAVLKVGERARLDLLGARSGVARGRGYVVQQTAGLNGRFLLSSPVGNVGFVIAPTGTETELFVQDDWLLSEGAPRGGALRPERGGMSQGPRKPAAKEGAGATARRLQ